MGRAVAASAFGLLLLSLSLSCSSSPPETDATVVGKHEVDATCGFTTSAPGEHLVRELELENNVRVRGRLIEDVEPGGPAEGAGLREGDVVLRLGDNDLYSADDVADFLAVSAPGDAVTAEYKRSGEGTRTTTITLGETQSAAPSEPGLRWQFASLGQLPRALELARARKKKVLVGLSGAET